MSKTQRTANIIFVVIISVMLFGVIGHEAIQHAIPDLNTPQQSELEGRKYQRFQKPTVSTVKDGSFQQSFSKFIADDIPLRNEIVISNAAAQRCLIELANLPLGYQSYPTFFGSTALYTPATGRVSEMPLLPAPYLSSSLEEAAAIWSNLIERYPDTHWFAFMPDRSAISLVAPGHDLVANPGDRIYWEDHFFSRLHESCTYIDGGFEDAEEWETAFFKTDHHWQIQGAYVAYRAIAKQLQVSPLEYAELVETSANGFWGTIARSGLCFSGDSDAVWDIAYNPSAIRVHINGEEVDATSLDKYLCQAADNACQISSFNAYMDWFHTDRALIQIENENAETDKTLLIIGDSFTNNIERLFAENYHVVYVIDPRLFTDDINQFISAIHPDDALIMISTYWEDESVLRAIK